VVTETLAPGRYKLETWGAEGGYRSSATYAGKGGYSVGEIDIAEPTVVFIHSGGSGNTGKTNGGFNGSGMRNTYNGGGGASDIRIGVDDIYHRVIVAGGGGSDGASSKAGGYGGGEAGQSRADKYGTGGFGGTQTGVSDTTWQATAPSDSVTTKVGAYGGFGFGGNGIYSSGYGGAGGGGRYGGSGSMPDGSNDDDRGGGSGFVWIGQSVPSGFGLTAAYRLKNASTTNGSQSFTSPTGTAETGHSGNGYVRITPITLLKQHLITATSENNEFGSVSGGGMIYENDEATVTATPAAGYLFVSWNENGTAVSTEATYTFTVTGSQTLTAGFAKIDPESAVLGAAAVGKAIVGRKAGLLIVIPPLWTYTPYTKRKEVQYALSNLEQNRRHLRPHRPTVHCRPMARTLPVGRSPWF